MASEETSSLVKNNGFAATTCIANSDPTRWRASDEESWSSASRESTPAMRPKPEARSKSNCRGCITSNVGSDPLTHKMLE